MHNQGSNAGMKLIVAGKPAETDFFLPDLCQAQSILFLVLITELLNSAVESAVDRIGDDVHELAGRAKDQGSAAVFVSLALVVVVWGSVIVHNFVLG